MTKSRRVYQYSELGINKPDVGGTLPKFVPVSEYEGKTFSCSDVELSTIVEDKVWRVGMDMMMTCGTCCTTHWGTSCQNPGCVKGKEAIAIAKRWENDRR